MGYYTWFQNNVRHLSADDLEYLKEQCRIRNCYFKNTFQQYVDGNVADAHTINIIYRTMGGDDNSVIVNTLLKSKIKATKNPYDRRSYKKSVWKREMWNRYRLHKKKKLRAGELKGLLRYYDVIDGNSDYVIIGSKFGSFRIHEETTKYFTSLNEFVEYLNEHPCSVYNVYLNGYRYNTPKTLPEQRYRTSWELESTQEELNKMAIDIVSRFFAKYPHGRIKLE
jgi:hypothetical protein